MKQTVVLYKTEEAKAEENEDLIKGVFKTLHARSPKGFRYLALKLGNNEFLHLGFLYGGDKSLSALKAFQVFRHGIEARCSERPQTGDAAIIGNYRVLEYA